jgi:putative acetyltransferase
MIFNYSDVMKIRLIKNEDAAEIARLRRAAIRNIKSQDYPADIIEQWAGRRNANFFRTDQDKFKRWVAVEKDKIIGFVEHDFEGELSRIYVHKDHQGKGVGSRLVDRAEESMIKLGFKKFTLESSIGAKTFYEKKGYKVVKEGFHTFQGKKALIYFMTKKLR